jgi:deazaflavin-dependent oxidoreductase (nitroreductase family)
VQRFGNVFVRLVLRSPLHALLSRSLLLFTYTGRRSGESHAIPVQYVRHGERILVFAAWPERKRWWRNFEGGARAVRLRERGHWIEGMAVVVTDAQQLEAARRVYLEKFPKAASVIGDAVLVEISAAARPGSG